MERYLGGKEEREAQKRPTEEDARRRIELEKIHGPRTAYFGGPIMRDDEAGSSQTMPSCLLNA
jgi:hypothetical protein